MVIGTEELVRGISLTRITGEIREKRNQISAMCSFFYNI